MDDAGNGKYKLLGFENDRHLAVVMVISTGKIVKIKLGELLASSMLDDLNKREIKEVYKKFYSGGAATTAYEVNDRHEKSWMTYVALNLMLLILYIFTNLAATKLVYLEKLDIVGRLQDLSATRLLN